MKIGMVNDLLKSAFRRPVTERYPFERYPAPEHYRGLLRWNPEKCTGCALCVKDCPAEALELIVVDKAAKRFVLRYYADRCTYCGQCAYSCRFDCIELSADDWELADVAREAFAKAYGRLEDVVEGELQHEPSPDADGAVVGD